MFLLSFQNSQGKKQCVQSAPLTGKLFGIMDFNIHWKLFQTIFSSIYIYIYSKYILAEWP